MDVKPKKKLIFAGLLAVGGGAVPTGSSGRIVNERLFRDRPGLGG